MINEGNILINIAKAKKINFVTFHVQSTANRSIPNMYTIIVNLLFVTFLCGSQYGFINSYSEDLNSATIQAQLSPSDDATEYTLPDLHANSIKLLKGLLVLGCITICPNELNKIIQYYNAIQNDLSNEEIQKMQEAIQSVQITERGEKVLIRLIGDEFADRGKNDYYTLLMIEHFTNIGINFEFILSNHGYEFIRSYENGSFLPLMEADFTQSLHTMRQFINDRKIMATEIISIINSFYKPRIKLISFSLNRTCDEIYIYTHAPVGLADIQYISKALHICYGDRTIEELATTIKLINKYFLLEYVFPQNVNKIYQWVYFLITNRTTKWLIRPIEQNGYKVYFVHGHDADESESPNVFNLESDNVIGKSENHSAGYLKIFNFYGHKIISDIPE